MFPTEPTAINHGFSALVKNRNFMLLWIGQLISQLADKVLLILMIDLLEKKYLPPHLSSGTGRFYLYMAFTLYLPCYQMANAGWKCKSVDSYRWVGGSGRW